jgi:hypothetical protein
MQPATNPGRHPITWISVLVVAMGFVLVNLQPLPGWWSMHSGWAGDSYDHGWPYTYMCRDRFRDADTGRGPPHWPWPFFDTPPMIRFDPLRLALDAIIDLALVVLTGLAVERYLRARTVPRRYTIRLLLSLTTVVCICSALARRLEARREFNEFYYIMLFVFPNCVVFLSLCCSAVLVAIWIGRLAAGTCDRRTERGE